MKPLLNPNNRADITQFAHRSNERDFVWFAPLHQAPVEGHQPRVTLSGSTEGWHPQCLSDSPIAERSQ